MHPSGAYNADRHAFFDEFGRHPAIFAEDLGETDDELIAFLEETGLPTMRVLQFGMVPHDDSKHMPHNYPENCIAYTGTHDNQTARGFYEGMPPEEREKFRFALRRYGSVREPVSKKMLRYVFLSDARMVIVPLADILDLGDEARLNTPGTVGSPNWEWRLTDYRGVKRKLGFMRELTQQSRRI